MSCGIYLSFLNLIFGYLKNLKWLFAWSSTEKRLSLAMSSATCEGIAYESLSQVWQGNPIIPWNSFQGLSPHTHTCMNLLTHTCWNVQIYICIHKASHTYFTTCLTVDVRRENPWKKPPRERDAARHPLMSEDTPMATWCSTNGRMSCMMEFI